MGHPIAGYSWEGYVIEQVSSFIATLTNDLIELSFYRTREGTEIDLVITRGVQPLIGIEVKINSTPKTSRGLTNAIQDLGTEHNFIVVPRCADPYLLKKNVEVIDLVGLLKKLEKILG